MFFFFFLSHSRRRSAARLRVGNMVRKYWRGEGRAFEGRVVEVVKQDTSLAYRIQYADGDEELHDEEDDSFELEDFHILEKEEPESGAFKPAWNYSDAPFGMQIALKRHMEGLIRKRLIHFITPKKPRRPGAYMSIIIKSWTEFDHLFFFGTLSDIQLQTDDQMASVLFLVTKKLPRKRIGHRKTDDCLQICAKGLVRRTQAGNTRLVFAYSRFDLVDGRRVNRYASIRGNPWDKKARK